MWSTQVGFFLKHFPDEDSFYGRS